MPQSPPSQATLRRYGLTAQSWQALYDAQHGVCPICDREWPAVELIVDHEHVKGWKKLPPEQRRGYVRGLVCRSDNLRVLPKEMTPAKARAVASYLSQYAAYAPAPLFLIEDKSERQSR